MKLKKEGIVFVSLADEDKEEAFPLVKALLDMGFSLATTGLTTKFMKEKGYETIHLGKASEGSSAAVDFIKEGKPAYVVNTRAILSGVHYVDGALIRRAAIESGYQPITSIDTLKALINVLKSE